VSLINNGVTLTVTDENEQIKNLKDDESINIELTGVGKLLKKDFKKSDFVNNSIKIIVRSTEKGASNITIGKSSFKINFIDSLKAISKFHIEHDGWGEVEHTLLHEMVHQWQVESGLALDHGPVFRRKARAVGIVPSAVRDVRSVQPLMLELC